MQPAEKWVTHKQNVVYCDHVFSHPQLGVEGRLGRVVYGSLSPTFGLRVVDEFVKEGVSGGRNDENSSKSDLKALLISRSRLRRSKKEVYFLPNSSPRVRMISDNESNVPVRESSPFRQIPVETKVGFPTHLLDFTTRVRREWKPKTFVCRVNVMDAHSSF